MTNPLSSSNSSKESDATRTETSVIKLCCKFSKFFFSFTTDSTKKFNNNLHELKISLYFNFCLLIEKIRSIFCRIYNKLGGKFSIESSKKPVVPAGNGDNLLNIKNKLPPGTTGENSIKGQVPRSTPSNDFMRIDEKSNNIELESNLNLKIDSPVKIPMPRFPSDVEIEAAQFAVDYPKAINTIMIDPPPNDVYIFELLDFYNDLDKEGGIAEELSDDGQKIKKKDFLEKIYGNIARISQDAGNHLVHQNDIPYIKICLLHVVAHLRNLKKQLNKEKLSEILLKEIAPALLHCGDRAVTDLEEFYFSVIKPSEDYVLTRTFKYQVLLHLQLHRRDFFGQIVRSCIWPIISNTSASIHYATSHRYYQRIFREKFGLGGNQSSKPSTFESRTDLCYKGGEDLVEKEFIKQYTGKAVVSYFTKILNSRMKASDISQRCFEFIKENYSYSDEERDSLLNEDYTWKEGSAFIVLKRLGILM